MIIKCLEASVARALKAWAEAHNVKMGFRDEEEGDKRVTIEAGERDVNIVYNIERSELSIWKNDSVFLISCENYWEVTLT